MAKAGSSKSRARKTTRQAHPAAPLEAPLEAHAAALEAHTAALNENTRALVAHAAASVANLNTMKSGDVYHRGPCINGKQEVWVSDGAGGLQKEIRAC